MFKYFYKDKKLLFISVLIMKALTIIMSVFISVILSKIINIITLLSGTFNTKPLLNIFIFSVIFVSILGILDYFQKYLIAKLIKNIIQDIRIDVMKGILNTNIFEYRKNSVGDYISLFNNNISKIETNYFKNILEIYSDILRVIFSIITLIWINPTITILSIFIMLIPTIIPKIFSKKLIKTNENIVKCFSMYNDKIKETFEGYEVIKNYNIEEIINIKNEENNKILENSKFINEKLTSKLYSISMITSVCCQFTLLIISGYFCILKIISIGEIIAITQLSGEAISPITNLSNKISEVKGVKSICDDLLNKINIECENKIQSNIKESNIIFKNVNFGYDKDKIILKNFSYKFEHNKKYIIVGETGSGKSTILKLIMKHFNNYDGDIYINDKNIKDINANNFSYLQQNNFLFNDTVRNNITMFKKVEDKDINLVINKCQLKKVIDKLLNGLDEIVGENGRLLSGGEKQRICIARALFNNKNVLLMDEATSALDNETSNIIENNILNEKDFLYICISHKLKENILKKFDKILVIKDGMLVEEGSFNDLIKKQGYFKTLYMLK